ncbi:ABC transporter substrate-binding protein [Paenibacillus endoradicis]|uniref:ABC transporter substrate-binding protein n=1 Tax=Paenibacillus endoradicis TaxID=2972487 RepID=UPI0021594DF6|nr:ABC transporter substrate-binding protein [Paenibacillus endoradicis]MCR8657770.1 ABC transporter substrate-binding protein [Paenibacillus endoradicis]
MVLTFRRLAIVNIIIALSVTLVGCSLFRNNGLPNNESDLIVENSLEDFVVDGDGYTLKLVYIGTPQVDEKLIEEEINKYLLKVLNANIDLVVLDWGSWDNKQNIMIASREEIDIIFTSQWSKHSMNVSRGAFLPLNDLLQQYGQGIIKSLDPTLLNGSKIEGISYGIPTNKEFAAQGGIIYRKDIAEQLNLDMSNIQTIRDLDEIYATLKQEMPSITPLFVKHGENLNSHYMVNYDGLGDTSIPGYILKDKDSTEVKPLYEIDRYIENLYIARDFFMKDYTNKDAATTQMMVNDALSSNEYFSIVTPIKPGKADELGAQTGLSGKLAQIELNQKSLATSETAGSMLAISSTTSHPELAMAFINLLHTDVYLNNLINFGIEGVHYKKISNNVIQQTDLTARYSPGSNWMLGNQFINYLWDTEDPDKWKEFVTFNEGAVQSPGLGFMFDGEEVRSEVAAVVNVDKQYAVALESGSVDPAVVLPEYIEKLKSAGIDKIIAAKQEQFDAFLAKQGRLSAEVADSSATEAITP